MTNCAAIKAAQFKKRNSVREEQRGRDLAFACSFVCSIKYKCFDAHFFPTIFRFPRVDLKLRILSEGRQT